MVMSKKNKTYIGIFTIILTLSINLSPIVNSNAINQQKTIFIETTISNEHTRNTIITETTRNHAEEIKQILVNLHDALNKNDRQKIIRYETQLYSKGILNHQNKKFFSNQNIMNLLIKTKNEALLEKIKDIPYKATDTIINNSFCITNIIGTGNVYVSGLGLTIAFILLIRAGGSSLLQFIFPIYMALAAMSSFIPCRAFLPYASITLNKGSISTLGILKGHQTKNINESTQVDLSGFSGLSINIPFPDLSTSFIFYCGFTIKTLSE